VPERAATGGPVASRSLTPQQPAPSGSDAVAGDPGHEGPAPLAQADSGGATVHGELQPDRRHAAVFLLGVDNTPLDNDRIRDDIRNHLARRYGPAARDRDWAIREQLFVELGDRDCLGALQRYRVESPPTSNSSRCPPVSSTARSPTRCIPVPSRSCAGCASGGPPSTCPTATWCSSRGRSSARESRRRSATASSSTSTLRLRLAEDHADRRLPVLRRVSVLPHAAAPKAGPLLRVLFIRLGALPADSTAARLLLAAYVRSRVKRAGASSVRVECRPSLLPGA